MAADPALASAAVAAAGDAIVMTDGRRHIRVYSRFDDRKDVVVVNAAVPYDRELLLAVGDHLRRAPSLSLDAIPAGRGQHIANQPEPDLHEGRIEREEHTAPRPDSGPP